MDAPSEVHHKIRALILRETDSMFSNSPRTHLIFDVGVKDLHPPLPTSLSLHHNSLVEVQRFLSIRDGVQAYRQ